MIDIYNEKKPRKLLLNKKQVDILRNKEVTLTVTNQEKSIDFTMQQFSGNVLKVSLHDSNGIGFKKY